MASRATTGPPGAQPEAPVARPGQRCPTPASGTSAAPASPRAEMRAPGSLPLMKTVSGANKGERQLGLDSERD